LKKETILFFEDSSKIKFGGGQEISLLALKSLQKDYYIQVFDYAAKSMFLDQVHAMELKSRRLYGYGKVVHHNYQSFSLGLLEILLFPFFLIINLFQVMRFILREKSLKKNPIIFCATKKVLVLAVIFSFFIKCRIVFYAHNINDSQKIITKCFNCFFKRCSLIFGVSQTVCDSLLPLETKLLYGATDINDNKIEPSTLSFDKNINVAVFASLLKWKGIDYFIKSFPLLAHKQKVEYWICGDGSELESLKALASDNPEILFKGFVDFTSVAKQIDIMVLPSVKPEAFGMNIIKAMHYGIPIIATDCGAHKELIEDRTNGLTILPKDSSAIAEKIDLLISEQNTYLRISNEAIKASKQFEFVLFRKKIINIIETLS
jgi:glycosyltransferase involved in cell wall biosynthesis